MWDVENLFQISEQKQQKKGGKKGIDLVKTAFNDRKTNLTVVDATKTRKCKSGRDGE